MDHSVDVLLGKELRFTYKDEIRLRHLIDTYGEVKNNDAEKNRYTQLKMRYQRMKNLVSVMNRNNREYWQANFHSIKQNDCSYPSKDLVWDCAVVFLDKLLEVGCSDYDTVERILKLYGFHCGLKHHYLTYEELNMAFCSHVRSLFHNDSICRCDFKGDIINFNADLLEYAMRANDLKFMTALLKYGVNIPHSSSCSKWFKAPRKLSSLWILRFYRNGITNCDEAWERAYNATNGNKGGFQRLHLITNMLRMLYVKWHKERIGNLPSETGPACTDEQFNDCMQCTKLYFRATVEPLISKDEILKFIYCPPIWDGIPEDFLASVDQDYKDMFPEESNALYTPRKLKHLCRYSLRKSLTEKKIAALPELLDNLLIPKRLRSYLLCEC